MTKYATDILLAMSVFILIATATYYQHWFPALLAVILGVLLVWPRPDNEQKP